MSFDRFFRILRPTPRVINYIAYGEPSSTCEPLIHRLRDAGNLPLLLGELKGHGSRVKSRRFLESILHYCASTECVGPSAHAADLLADSLRLRRTFKLCRIGGFSCVFASPSRVRMSLSPRINLRFALFFDQALYYPPSVRAALRDLQKSQLKWHVRNAIGWALGAETSVGKRLEWFIVNMQSDLPGRATNNLRSYFDDWHKLLLLLIIGEALRRNVDSLHVVPAETLATTYLGRGKLPPVSWKRYYDWNAARFGFCLCDTRRMNFSWAVLNPHYADRFFTASRETLHGLASDCDLAVLAGLPPTRPLGSDAKIA